MYYFIKCLLTRFFNPANPSYYPVGGGNNILNGLIILMVVTIGGFLVYDLIRKR